MSGRFAWVLCCLALATLPLGELGAQGNGLEVRAGGVTLVSQRSAKFDGAVGTGSGNMTGGELSVRFRYVGLTARLFGGGFAADSGSEAVGKVHSGDIRLLVGPRVLSADVGYGRRTFTGAFGDRRWGFARIGLRSSLAIGASGLSAEWRLALYTGVSGSAPEGGGSGREGETRLVYVPRQLPLYVAVGYRHERFTVSADDDQRPEEVSGVLLAVGFRLPR